MEEILTAIRSLSDEELQKLQREIDCELKRRLQSQNVFSFEVEYTNDPRKGVPYAARITQWNAEKRQFEREFFDLVRHWGKGVVTVSGTITASPGEVIEIRKGGSWKNDYRYFYLMTQEGELALIGPVANSTTASLVRKYLEGKITYEDLLREARK